MLGARTKLMTDYLFEQLDNKIIVKWVFIKGKYKVRKPCNYKDFRSALPLLVEQVACKGKIIYFVLYNEYCKYYILHSLQSEGEWQEKEDELCKWYILLNSGKKIWFKNTSKLETLQFTSEKHIFDSLIGKLGEDILTENFSLNIWYDLIKNYSHLNVTVFLSNQHIISGCDSCLKCEVLYYSKISPFRKIKSLTENEVDKLYEGLRILSRCAYASGELNNDQLQIYEKEYATCVKTPDKKITYWDPSVQT